MNSRVVLCSEPVSASAPGKVILLGEHSVVYGYPALAAALPDVRLRLTIRSLAHMQPRRFDIWRVRVRGKVVEPEGQHLDSLHAGLLEALLCFGIAPGTLAAHAMEVDSDVPLGAGMGGSAALSVALVRALASCLGRGHDGHLLREYANRVDGVFHTSASGVDVAAVESESIIHFERDKGPRSLAIGGSFWLALVDSGTRARTADMVARVRMARAETPEVTNGLLDRLGRLAVQGEAAIAAGNLDALGGCLNQAHETLERLGVSTHALDAVCHILRTAGALGAKLTGGGGGGLVLGLFREDPSERLRQACGQMTWFCTQIRNGVRD